MLLGKSKFDAGDIISLKLINGEEVIGKFVSEDMSEITLLKPVMLAITKSGPAMAPVMMTVDPDREYAIAKNSIMFKGNTVREIADQYTYQTTGIQPVSAGSIVTG
jgi:hypothetical protein